MQRDVLDDALESVTDPGKVGYLHGVTGSGKTTILQMAAESLIEDSTRVYYVDLEHDQTPYQVAQTIADTAPFWQFRRLKKLLKKLNGIRTKLESATGSLMYAGEAGAAAAAGSVGGPPGAATAAGTVGSLRSVIGKHLESQEADLLLGEDQQIANELLKEFSKRDVDSQAILFDTLEASPSMEEWLLSQLLGAGLPQDAGILVASQNEPGSDWRRTVPSISAIEVGPFKIEEAEEYITHQGISPSTTEEVINKEYLRLPWVIKFLADNTTAETNALAEVSDSSLRRDQFHQRLISTLPPEIDREELSLCALPRFFNEDLMKKVDPDIERESYQKIVNLSAVKRGPQSTWSLHEAVREPLLQHLRESRPEWWEEKNREFSSAFKELSNVSTQQNSIRFLKESAFHEAIAEEGSQNPDFTQTLNRLIKYHDSALVRRLLEDLENALSDSASSNWIQYYQAELSYIQNDEDESVEKLESLLNRGGSQDLQRAVRISLGGIYRRQGRSQDAIEILSNARELASESGDDFDLARASYILSATFRRLGRWDEAVELCEEAESLLSEQDSNDEYAWAMSERAFVEFFRGNLSQSRELFEKALGQLEGSSARLRRLRTRRRLGRLLIYTGDWHRSKLLLQQAEDELEVINNRYGIGRSANHLGFLYVFVGRYESARESLLSAREEFESFESPLQMGMNASYLAFLEFQRGHYPKGFEWMESAFPPIEDVGDAFHQAEAAWISAFGSWKQGGEDVLEKIYEERDRLTELPQIPYYQQAFGVLEASSLFSAGKPEDAAELCDELISENASSDRSYTNHLADLMAIRWKAHVEMGKEPDLDGLVSALDNALEYNPRKLYSVLDEVLPALDADATESLAEVWQESLPEGGSRKAREIRARKEQNIDETPTLSQKLSMQLNTGDSN